MLRVIEDPAVASRQRAGDRDAVVWRDGCERRGGQQGEGERRGDAAAATPTALQPTQTRRH
jgi:hypothetical protein